jgi:hypothetical protein
MNRNPLRASLAILTSALLLSAVGCSNSGTSTSLPGSGVSTGGTINLQNPPTGPNVVPITVNGGPLPPYANAAFTSVTVCVPGSTTECQTIGGILVDTGSYGLRIENAALSVALPQQTQTGNAVVECAEFNSGFAWGPVQTATVTIGGETSSSAVPVQVMGSPSFPDTDGEGASDCANGEAGTSADLNSVENLGANGILGVGLLAQDCGSACTSSGPSNAGFYYSCPTASTCAVTAEALDAQVVNPVVSFPVDNNGVIVELPAISAATADTAANGVLVFGIGTESNNGLGSASIYGVDGAGDFETAFQGESYTSFLDLGTNYIYFLDPDTIGVPECEDVALYCPQPNATLSATNEGQNGTIGDVTFTIGDADSFVDNQSITANYAVENGIVAPYPVGDAVDWGLPFFYGLNVYVAINGQTTPAGVGPFWAY